MQSINGAKFSRMDQVKFVKTAFKKFEVIWFGYDCNFIKKETLTQVFSCEICKIVKNIYFYRTPLVAASECYLSYLCH